MLDRPRVPVRPRYFGSIEKGEVVRRSAGLIMVVALLVLVAAVGAGAPMAAGNATTVLVTNSNDSGAGSFRRAAERASDDSSIGTIVFRVGLAPIALASPVVYDGVQSLSVLGAGAVLKGGGFRTLTPGNLSVAALTIRDVGDHGLVYEVPGDASGTKKVSLVGVRILNNGGHGVLVDDQVNPETPDTDPPTPPDPAGSAASLDVKVLASQFAENGFGGFDRDGLRVDEGADGNLSFSVALSSFEHNGADGIELDERGPGNAVFDVTGVTLSRNGDFDTTPPIDKDDGMDVDESLDGDLIGRIAASVSNDNFEEGWDLNENNAGDFKVDMTLVEASRNVQEGIDFEEDDDFAGGGSLFTVVTGIKTDGNQAGGDGGLKIREKGVGDLNATVRSAQANGNQTAGISIREDAVGNLTANIDRSRSDGNTGHGTDLDENSDGNLTAAVTRGSSATNGGAGVRADQGGAGTGTLNLSAMNLDGNTGGPVVNNAGVTVTQTP